MRLIPLLLLAGLSTCGMHPAFAADQCRGVDAKASVPLREATKTAGCKVRMSPTGYPLPDPECTPGAANPTVTAEILRDPAWHTTCVRDGATSAAKKRSTYAAYGIAKPKNNSGKNQTVELDHLISLELAGGDALDNIWPEAGPPRTVLAKRWFKIKDAVENYLAREVKEGRMELEEAQRGIAEDWSQYVPAAQKARKRKR